MEPYFAEIEQIEFDAAIDFFRAAPDEVRSRHAVTAREMVRTTCLSAKDLEPPAIFRRVLGLGVDANVTESELDAALSYMSGLHQRYVIPVAAEYRCTDLGVRLEQRGFSRGYAWMKFCCECSQASHAATDLTLREIDGREAENFGRVVTQGFGLPESIASWVGALPGRDGWICVMGFDGDRPVAAGAAHIRGEYAWLGFGATLPSHRGRGAQSAILSVRLAEAAIRGCRFAVTETGERLPDKTSISYRNILRAGFRECYVRQNFVSA